MSETTEQRIKRRLQEEWARALDKTPPRDLGTSLTDDQLAAVAELLAYHAEVGARAQVRVIAEEVERLEARFRQSTAGATSVLDDG